ncbi:rare lipoprotein A [Novosphingobium sp. CF614]|uniref:septal ring lytic transglycosylase RlpA family protein n=1 Tax=Novosphingobium sp. CF614 TaxID=1884364 RepID=UPI0008E5F97C|nr:septal ring lytic transglycosylase RlpA family protein [Novosphingobium sp. CF614]SFG11266.1 rare lipoprotein A [Novosphingobium sp. CF614]
MAFQPIGQRINQRRGQQRRGQRTGFLATLAAAMTLPLAGPVHADSRDVHIAINDAATPAVPASIIPAPDAPRVEPQLEPIGSGMASFYGRSLAGSRTASGQRFDPGALTAAHRTLPFGTQVQVTNASTGDSVIVTINDRGPFHSNRVIDLSEAAARQIGIARAGSGMVQLAVLSPGG